MVSNVRSGRVKEQVGHKPAGGKLTVCLVAIGATMLATLEVVIWDGMATI